jgi:two-component system NtrC family sensor kinase
MDLNAVIQSVVDLREYQVNADGIRFIAHLSEEPCRVVGDFHQLQQLLLNIVNNAHQAIIGARQGSKIEIRTASDSARNRVVLSVSDDGPGILPDVLPKIFDPFFTTREVGQGTGLGLSVAYGIARDHGGHISVESSPGKGATFYVELPLAKSVNKSMKAEAAPARVPSPEKKINVLLVDDEEVILDLLTDILTQMNVTVERAHNGNEALARIAASTFDGIICDLKMPGMDGKTLYGRIQEQYPDLCGKVIFSTGDTLSNEFRAFCAATSCKVVEKPFLIEDIKKAIEALSQA